MYSYHGITIGMLNMTRISASTLEENICMPNPYIDEGYSPRIHREDRPLTLFQSSIDMRSDDVKMTRDGCIRFGEVEFLLIDGSADRFVDEDNSAFRLWISSPGCIRWRLLSLKTFQMIRNDGGQVTSKPIIAMRASVDIVILFC